MSELLEYVISALHDSPESITQIANGAGVNPRWLRYIAARQIPSPGVVRLERVAKYLREKAKEAA